MIVMDLLINITRLDGSSVHGNENVTAEYSTDNSSENVRLSISDTTVPLLILITN